MSLAVLILASVNLAVTTVVVSRLRSGAMSILPDMPLVGLAAVVVLMSGGVTFSSSVVAVAVCAGVFATNTDSASAAGSTVPVAGSGSATMATCMLRASSVALPTLAKAFLRTLSL